MKNSHQIISSLQSKPQFKKLLHQKCIAKLFSVLLPSIQKNIQHGYTHKNRLFIITNASLNKYDKDNIIKTIKMVLNSPMILESKKFLECEDFTIEDVVVYTSHKPKQPTNLHTTSSHTLIYKERAFGTFQVDVKNKEIATIVHTIQKLLQEKHHDA